MQIELHKNTAAILALAVALGFFLPEPAERLEPLVIPALFVMMAFSMAGIELRLGAGKEAATGFLLNYLFLSGLILLLAPVLLEEEALVLGFVVMAAAPPAVAVVPLTKLLQGDVRLALYSEALSYLGSLVLTPLIISVFARGARVGVEETAEIVLLLILLPILASRQVGRLKIDPAIPINAGLFVVTYIVVGLNSTAISTEAAGVLLIAFARTFLSGAVVYAGAVLAGVDRPQRIAYTLFASFKNLGLAATVALLLFGPRAGIPAAVCILTETSFYILLSALAGRRDGDCRIRARP
ncbi:bile acid:sodium symporter [Methanocrinis sp.]|uniref:bile acid:sodium symporter n=1 Tax=Methanocrinis sp. TaxID=3101522 RepID=UPI003D12881B